MEYGEQVQLLLSAPGHPPVALPPSPWRARVWTERGPVDLATAAQGVRLSPVSPRAERALVAAVQADDVDSLGRLAASSGPAQDAAVVLSALRLAGLDPQGAIDLLAHAVQAPVDPTANKVFKRHWSGLAVQVALAPSVPALYGAGRTSLALLLAELLAEAGRTGESLGVLESLPPAPPVILSRAAALLALGEHHKVLEVTASLPNVDDVAALALVARSVAARTEGTVETALTAVCAALDVGDRSPAVLAAALEERAHLYTMSGEAVAARSDLEALAQMATGRTDVPIPRPATLKRPDDELSEDESLDRARDRMRRRITGVGAPGTFGGRHHSTYRDEIATMFAHGQIAAVEELLLGLLDAVEDEVDELGVPLDATFFLTLADLYQDNGRTEDLMALRERYAAADSRSRRNAAEAAGADAASSTPDPAVAGAAAPAGPSLDKVPVAAGGVATPPPEAQAVEPAVGPAVEPVPVGAVAAPGATTTVVPVAATFAEERLADVLTGPAPDDAAALVDAPGTAPRDVAVDVGPPASAAVPPSAVGAATGPEAADGPAGGPEEGADVDLAEAGGPGAAEPKPERELTAVERAVRGPRVRSL